MRGLFRLFADFSANSETLRGLRNQSHIAALYILVFICICTSLFYLFTPLYNSAAQRIILLCLCTLAMLYSASLIAAKYTDISGATGYFSTLWTGAIVLCLCIVNGGIPYSDASPLILAPMTMSFCFLGLRAGIGLNIVFLGCFISLGAMTLSGSQFPDLLETRIESVNQMIVWGSCFFFLLAVLYAYEWMIAKLLNRRGGSESELHRIYSGSARYHIVAREHFENFLHEAEQRCIQHEDHLVLCSLHLPSGDPDFVIQCMDEIQPLLRNIDTLIRTEESTFSFILENVSSEKSAQYFLNSLSQHLVECGLFPTTEAFNPSYSCMPGSCNSWQDLIRSTKPYYSQTDLSKPISISSPYA